MCTATCDGKRAANLQNEQFNSQQLAAYAAGKQNKFWQFTELFYHQQGSEGTGYANDAYLSGLAEQIPGLNLTTWQTRPRQLRAEGTARRRRHLRHQGVARRDPDADHER